MSLRCLFLVQGDGRGHQTQAIALAEELIEAGHEVVDVLAAQSPRRTVPRFFLSAFEALGVPVHIRSGLETVASSENRRVSPTRTFWSNAVRTPLHVLSALTIRASIRRHVPDVVVCFYDTLGGIALRFPGVHVPVLCVGHHYLLWHPDFRFPAPLAPGEMTFLRAYSRWSMPGRAHRMALSFGPMTGAPERRLRVTPPLLRQAVLDATPTDGSHLVAYVLNAGYGRDLEAWHRRHRDVELHVFWDGPDERRHRNLSFHALDDRLFLELLAGSTGLATTGGFESVCEAAALGKPVMSVPSGCHVEQRWNAWEAQDWGIALCRDRFDMDAFLRHAAGRPVTPLQVREWIRHPLDAHLQAVEAAAARRTSTGGSAVTVADRGSPHPAT